ncbi:pyroglutamyl-peptidase I [Cupriavidus pauculus]|uniref:Pyrrolidone-carboxylate peptidase n=1 Tax=Cupriavidus pauculus TaxID=82633 RepID=A0A2N5CIF0_9BURK|nr:pyroglutamyl-peptidase I [Cupriavidus pauculus]PLQ01993.1 pyroglutamyl-peptidase I [Cupriavidus pauculus]
MSVRTVLLTGFEPFEQEPINPSWEAVRALDGARVGDAVIVARQLPCVFGDAIEAMASLVETLKPDVVIAVGQAGGRTEMSIERVAINVDDARIADNAGAQPIDNTIVPDGPAAYFSTLPIKAIVRDMRAAGVPAMVSQTAGTFVCNHVFYGLMHALAQRQATPTQATRGGFIHIPYLPEQAARHPGAPSLALDTLIAGLRVAVTTSLSTDTDIREQGGQLH